VSLNYFSDHIFPLYEKLASDKDDKVRKTCAEVVADIANVSPLDRKAQALSDLYFKYLKDPTSSINILNLLINRDCTWDCFLEHRSFHSCS